MSARRAPTAVALRQQLGPYVVSICASLAIAVATVHSPKLSFLALGAAGAVLFASLRPRAALIATIALMALPYTWTPQVASLGGDATVLGPLLLGLTALPRLQGFRFSKFDLPVAVFAFAPAVVSFAEGAPFHIVQVINPEVAVPYFGFRVFLAATPEAFDLLPAAITWVGSAAAAIGIFEFLVGKNPVAGLYGDPAVLAQWDQPLHRSGHLRAASTFGHPIAFGAFLLIPLAFALTRPGRAYLFAAALLLAGEAVTLSRGPIVGAIALVVLLRWGKTARRRTFAVATAATLAALFLSPLRRLVTDTGRTSTEAGVNADYRLNLLHAAIHDISVFGHPFTDLSKAIANMPDLASLLVFTIVSRGALGLVALGLFAVFAVSAFASRRDGMSAALLAQLVTLMTTTLITNYEMFFWLLAAMVATITATERARARVDTAPLGRPVRSDAVQDPSPATA